jgi:hypothetical protein
MKRFVLSIAALALSASMASAQTCTPGLLLSAAGTCVDLSTIGAGGGAGGGGCLGALGGAGGLAASGGALLSVGIVAGANDNGSGSH